jgi:hypothetical protein
VSTRYFVVDAPGYYGDSGRVYGDYDSVAAALKAWPSPSVVVREGTLEKGDVWTRSQEQHYPIVARVGGARTQP